MQENVNDLRMPSALSVPLSMKWKILLFLSVLFVLVAAPELAGRMGQPDPAGNIAAGATISSRSTMGIIHYVLRGDLPREGCHYKSGRAVIMSSKRGMIQLDFGSLAPIKALLVQADYDDGYTVEASLDGENWDHIWTITVAKNGKGMRSRHHVFDNPVHARHLKIYTKYPGISAISAIRAYSSVPKRWPFSGRASAKSDLPSFSETYFRGIFKAKFVIALIAAFLLTVVLVLDKFDASDQKKKPAMYLLILISIIASLGWWNYYRIDPQFYCSTYTNHWDVYHYYLGSKYSPELKYTNLYTCYLMADAEDGFGQFQTRRHNVRELKTNAMVKTQLELEKAEKCKAYFSKARWKDFKKDHAWFRTRLPSTEWMRIPLDHGYNPSPAWAILGRALSSLGAISDIQFLLLISVDTALLLGMFILLWNTFGWIVTCAALTFWGTNFLAGNWFTTGAFLRLDWLFLSIAGLCCLKRRKMAVAGFLFTYATLIRVFPGFFLGGILLKILGETLGRRKFSLSKQHRSLLLGAAVGAIIVIALSLIANNRMTVWNEFHQNLLKHHKTSEIVQSIGIGSILRSLNKQDQPPPPPDLEKEGHNQGETTHSYKIFRIILAFLFLMLLLAAVVNEEDWIAAVLGICWLPFVTGLSNYYYAVLIVFAVLMVRKKIIGFGFAALIVVCASMGLVPVFKKLGLEFNLWSSVIVMIFFLWVTILFAGPWFTGKQGGSPLPDEHPSHV